MYGSAFCRAYNEFGWNVYPEVFAGQLLRFLDRRGAAVHTALDLGCGTGILCRELIRSGIRAVGVDLSEDMIAIAREKAPVCRFDVADMVSFRPAERFDLVTCTGDALNHVFSPGDVQRIFDNVSAYLAPGGYFVFDLLGEGEIPDDEPFVLDYSDTVRAVFRTVREPENVVRLRVEVFENGRFSFAENILEKVHDVGQVCAMLRRSGLAVEQRSHRLLEDEGFETAAWFVAARKPIGETM